MRILRAAALVVLLGGLGMTLVGCPHGSRAPRHTTAPPRKEPITLRGTFSHSRFVWPATGPRVWVAEVDSGRIDAQDGTLQLHGVACELYQAGKLKLKITADGGRAVRSGSAVRLSLSGHVRATSQARALTLAADALRWASADGVVHVVRPHGAGMGFEHWADSGSYSPDLARVTLLGHIRVESID
jgi:hypothetical protein